MNGVIIAPTIAFSKKNGVSNLVDTNSIVDAINPNQQNVLEITEKPVSIIPYCDKPAMTRNKRNVDLTTIKMFHAQRDEQNRSRLQYETLTENKNMTFFPDTSIIKTGQIIGGTISSR